MSTLRLPSCSPLSLLLSLLLAAPALAQDPGPPAPFEPPRVEPRDDSGGEARDDAPAGPEETAEFVESIPDDTERVTTDSGLVYSVLRPGTGDVRPETGDMVTVHYTGWTVDGRVFDSSRRRGEPAEFALGKLIAGWNEALEGMTVGERRKLTIPPDLAYGERGNPPVIPANATLVFDMELIDVKRAPRFTPPDPEAQVTTASGLKYEVLREGSGVRATKEHAVDLSYALFNTRGDLLEATAQHGRTLSGTVESLPVDFMKEALLLMREGGRYRFEVPPALAFGERAMHPELLPANSVTIWEIEPERIVPLPEVPAFSMPPEAELETTASGLRYQVIREGDAAGPAPKLGEMVEVHYAGWLTDGTLFDSSYGRGFPTSFQLGRVIAGWNEGLQLMKPGAIYKFVIPGKLAYGPRGSPPKIGPNATLVFLVEYLGDGEE